MSSTTATVSVSASASASAISSSSPIKPSSVNTIAVAASFMAAACSIVALRTNATASAAINPLTRYASFSAAAAAVTALGSLTLGYVARNRLDSAPVRIDEKMDSPASAACDDHYSLCKYPVTRYTAADSLRMQKETMANIEASSLVTELRANPDYVNVPAYLPSKPEERQHGFTTHSLSGPSKLIVSPVVFQHVESARAMRINLGREPASTPVDYSLFGETSPAATSILHLGRSLCGHYGIIHGGLIATILDEMLARSAMPFLPGMTGFTANLNIDYRSPAVADQLVVARSWPMGPLEGRKIRVRAEIRSLKNGKLLAEATSVFVTPKKVADAAAATAATVKPARTGDAENGFNPMSAKDTSA